jgi:outer membrane protein
MKKIYLTIALILLSACAVAAESKIGYIDLNMALNQSEQGKKAVATLEEMVKAKQFIIAEKGEKIKKIEEELAKQSSILTEDAIKERKEEREKLLRDYQRMVKDSQEEVQKKQATYMDAIIKELKKIVSEIGKEEGYSIILEKAESGVMFHSENIDLTNTLIKRFNETAKSN